MPSVGCERVGEGLQGLGLGDAVDGSRCPGLSVRPAVPEPLDLKWFTIDDERRGRAAPAGLKAWASGSRALANAALPTSTLDAPTRSTAAGL